MTELCLYSNWTFVLYFRTLLGYGELGRNIWPLEPVNIRNMGSNWKLFLISNLRRIINVVFFLLGDSPASEFYVPTFRNTVSSISIGCVWRWNWQCVPKRRHIKFGLREITEKKEYNNLKFLFVIPVFVVWTFSEECIKFVNRAITALCHASYLCPLFDCRNKQRLFP